MSVRHDFDPPIAFSSASPLTPSEQTILSRRRSLMALANGATLLLVLAALVYLLSHGGWTLVDTLLLACALAITPWHALGFWNALTGLVLLHGRRDGVVAAAPFLKSPVPLRPSGRVAILMTLRNEDPDRAIARLRAVKADLDAAALPGLFDYHLLSDTSRADVALMEEELVARWQIEEGAAHIFYRRRPVNTGFKAGNIRDFCTHAGLGYELMLPLDADSLMGADTVMEMVAIMQANPRLGILQSLAVGLPAQSAFARMFQFGMRHGMRCYTLGAAWWSGECGPYWGHNALIRVAPFREFCHLPILAGPPPLGGPILSHDQVEAALMRRAGYEVRVLPVERESYEENPPAVTDFIARDLRWCLGNLQYVKLLGLPGLLPMSRFQLVWAILMFITAPALPLLLVLLPFAALEARAMEDFPAAFAIALYAALLFLSMAPKLAGLADVMLTRGGMARYGGPARFLGSAVLELCFSFLLSALTAMAVSIELLRLALGRVRTRWGAQARDGHRISLATALRAFWWPTLFGLAVTAGAAYAAPALLPYLAPLVAGYVLAVPFAMLTAEPALGALMVRLGLCAIPEEFDPPDVVRALAGETPRALEQAA